MRLDPIRVLVTGGAGFIGSALCERLLRDGLEVICVDNFVTGRAANIAHLLAVPGFRLVTHDVIEPLDLPGPLHEIFHLASPASPVDYQRLPLETLRVGSAGTDNMLALARAKNARFLLASTSEVYGDPLEHPQREAYLGNVNTVGPRSVYDEAKRYAEAITAAYHRTYGTDTAIARIFNTFGPRMRLNDGRVVPNFIAQALAGKPFSVNGTGKQTRSLCYVDDMVEALLSLMRSPHHGPVNLGSTEEMAVLDIAGLIADQTGNPLRFVYAPLGQDDPEKRRPDTALAHRLLGWSPAIGIPDGIARTISWFRTDLGRTS
ncbi:dTDP-glucose 4,6-dehydratase [Acrocarpospora corrugata]|uniref:dTDP-glucose 4,6-dehydratase n=1 Tax=Acrocarpospora corrugata TaxID=35763 RepID=A0A5M3WC25_9ACTN|nr:UDP-glucuronic acid decarboxylase family protein [Acrocarpospora corrugata]GES03988.1 dTDP-glucose 4,6-dehydratase [Acrocarpospora corrugata]